MNVNQSNRLSVFLMLGSLLLLLLFLCFWLKNVYAEVYKSLQKDTDYLFSESVRAMEDELLGSLYDGSFSFSSQDSVGVSVIKIKMDAQEDHSGSMTIVERGSREVLSDSIYKMAIQTSRDQGKDKQIFGSLALSAILKNNKASIDSFLWSKGDSSILASLETYVEKNKARSEIPLNFQVVRLTAETERERKLISSSYTDLFNGETYALQNEEHYSYLLKKMLPEFLFSLFLFSSISLAFFVIYRSLQQQRKLTQIKNEFISNVTHELKTPITTVGVAIEALTDFDVLNNRERTKEYLNISKHELNRLSILVDKVLKMSLFEKKEPELKLESLNINQLIQGILETMKLQFDKWNAKVSFKPLETATFVNGDKIHLTSVLYNLIDNALKYSSGQASIDISLEDTGQQIKLRIKDKGIGILPEYKDKIFEKFFRVPSGDTHNAKGYGLGLSYVTSVVKKHNGKIEVESIPGKGTCFTVCLPQ